MPLEIIEGDITKLHVDAIVNAANVSLLGGGGVDGCIHRAAGPELLAECRTLNGCETGEAKITKGYRLPCRYVIHTPGPIWDGGRFGEKKLLASCYKNCLRLAAEHDCKSVAFPMISTGVYGYPKPEAMKVATSVVSSFLENHDMQIYFVIFGRRDGFIDNKLYKGLDEYISSTFNPLLEDLRQPKEDHSCAAPREYVDEAPGGYEDSIEEDAQLAPSLSEPYEASPERFVCSAPSEAVCSGLSAELASLLANTEETFSQVLLRKISEKGLSDSQCYKKANIDRRLFSKIRSDENYHPKKQTALAFAVALELSLEETAVLLKSAGYALSPSSKADIIVEYFIERGQYDIFEINTALFTFGQDILA
ncbi:MAG: O-acetyl-ADP-ribose deacetylase [bacterium]|nr:O-acetyl-ADP-ribose deacetylase [bacterium]